MLDKNPYDQAAWLLKCEALTKKSWVDDLEIDEEGVADILMGMYCMIIVWAKQVLYFLCALCR